MIKNLPQNKTDPTKKDSYGCCYLNNEFTENSETVLRKSSMRKPVLDLQTR